MYTVKVMFITSPFHISYCRQHSKPELQMSALRKKGNVVFFLKNTTDWYAYNSLIIRMEQREARVLSSALEMTQWNDTRSVGKIFMDITEQYIKTAWQKVHVYNLVVIRSNGEGVICIAVFRYLSKRPFE